MPLTQELFFQDKILITPQGEMIAKLEACDILEAIMLLKGPPYDYNQLTDLTAIDYLLYGVEDWDPSGHHTGYSRAVVHDKDPVAVRPMRFAVVYQLLSHNHTQRLRIKVYLSEEYLHIPSIAAWYPNALWCEREVFDLFGIIFDNHPSLDRILTDDRCVGHPMRKDFPLSGTYDVRYDADSAQVIQEPSEHFARIETPKIIRYKDKSHGG